MCGSVMPLKRRARSIDNPPSGEGPIYALPDDTGCGTQIDPQTTTDGHSYSATYQANGRCHIYHEVELERRGSLDHPLCSQHATNEDASIVPTSHRKENSVPRFSISTGAQPAQFHSTQNNTRTLGQPYLEAVDSKSLEHLPSSMLDANLQQSDNSVNRSLVRRHTFDWNTHPFNDEGYQIPTHEVRKEFLGSDSTEDMYSKLERPYAKRRDNRGVTCTRTFIKQRDVYSSSTTEPYNQPALRKYQEIKRDQIHVITALGSGRFGAVSCGYWQVPRTDGKLDVAIKFLRPGSSEEDKTLFLQEAAIMGQFKHPNIVRLYGVVTVGEPLMIILELMPNGDLKKYLKYLSNRVPNLPVEVPELLLNFCRQIAKGMEYLSNKAFIHRDLTARNILLTEDFICKIGDFGMTRALANEETYQFRGGQIPLKWTAPEALNYHQFTAGSDVWSYGIVLFEIWSLGQQPFRRVADPNKLTTMVTSGYCQAPPPGCPRAIYQLMTKCWHPDHTSRPRFSDICDYLSSPDETLLQWTHEDRIVSPSVTHLGAPLSEARNLYPDLQFCYYDNDTQVETEV